MNKFFLYFFLLTSITAQSMVIDNLDNVKKNWVPISDRVMGGISIINFEVIDSENGNFYRISGDVSTKNNGGFIQIQTLLPEVEQKYSGIKFMVRGNNNEFYSWIRTKSCRLPWDRYSSTFNANEEWQQIKIPFEDFKKSNFYLPKKIKNSAIRSMAFAAYGKDFSPVLDIKDIQLY